jgi:hypothetical protein
MSVKKKHPYLNVDKISVLSKSEMMNVFNSVKNLDLPFEYQKANCHNLSHFIKLFLESQQIYSAKIWAFAPIVYANGGNDIISFIDKKELSPTGHIEWGYHVASVISVKFGNKKRLMVIDLGLFPDAPVEYNQWIQKLKTKRLIRLIINSEWYLFNSCLYVDYESEASLIENLLKNNLNIFGFSKNNLITDFYRYEDEAEINHWIESGLAVNQTAIEFYNLEIKPLMGLEPNAEIINEYKSMVGNVLNFETVFRDRCYNYEMNEDFINKHWAVISKYQSIYIQNLEQWTQKTNQIRSQIS